MNREMLAAADATEGAVNVMDAEEQRLVSERQSREGASFSVIAGVLLTGFFLAFVFFLIHHQMIMDQVRERSRAEIAQRNLSARLLNLQDEEARRFARELHDSVGHHLAAIKMGVAIPSSDSWANLVITDCLTMADDAIRESRTISHLLHPPLLDQAGLNSAIRWFVEGFAKRSGIHMNVQVPDSAVRFDNSVELVLFRVLQSGLTNVHRHSGANRADVTLSADSNRVTLSVRDSGKGMASDILRSVTQDGIG